MSLRKDSEASARASAARQPAAGAFEADGETAWSQTEPMTEAQAGELKRLAQDALEPEAFDASLTQAQAARRIDALRAKLALQDGPPHTL
jgi:hypothetical protein